MDQIKKNKGKTLERAQDLYKNRQETKLHGETVQETILCHN